MKTKKAYMKTLEAMIAVVLTFSVIAYVTSFDTNETSKSENSVLHELSKSDEYRFELLNLSSCLTKESNTTVINEINLRMDNNLNYYLCPSNIKPSLPKTNVNVKQIYLNPKFDNQSEKVIKLYYWVSE